MSREAKNPSPRLAWVVSKQGSSWGYHTKRAVKGKTLRNVLVSFLKPRLQVGSIVLWPLLNVVVVMLLGVVKKLELYPRAEPQGVIFNPSWLLWAPVCLCQAISVAVLKGQRGAV